MAEVERPDQAWDVWVASRGGEGDYLQTAAWAAVDEAANGRASFVARSGGTGALVSVPRGGGGDLRCLHGPVFSGNGIDDRELHDLLAVLERLARAQRARRIRFVGRPVTSSVDVDVLAAAFATPGFVRTPWLTAVIALDVSDEELLDRVDRSVRKALRRCEREGLEVRRCGSANEFERGFLSAFASAAGGAYDAERDRRAFMTHGGQGYAYFVAERQPGEILATLGTYRYGGVATEIMSSRTEIGRQTGLPAQDWLHWHAIRHHRELGDRWFDLAGFAPSPANEKEAGIRRFKEKWGGTTVPSPTFEKVLDGRLMRVARRVRERVA